MAYYISNKPRNLRMTFPKSMLLVPAIVLVMRLASPATADLSYLVLAAYALVGRPQAIQALFLSWLISMFNPGLAPEASFGSIGRYAVIAGAMLSVLLRSDKSAITYPVLTTLLLGAFIIAHSLVVSSIPDVSVLKGISFVVVFATLLSAWRSLNPQQRVQTEFFVFGGMIAIVLASLPFITGGVGYLRNGTGFQGILNHPQAFGPFVALLCVWLAGRFLSERKMPLWQVGLLALCPVLVMASEARTAGLALALGIALPVAFSLMSVRYRLTKLLPGILTARFAVAIAVVGIGVLAFSTVIFTQLEFFLFKSGRSTGTNLVDAMEASRGILVFKMIDNIKEYPIGGIGFGIASFPDAMAVARDPFFGLPVGAPIEKGVMPLAVVEELGIPGAMLVFAWLWMLIRRSARAGFASLTVITTALVINLGENIFFSAGGMGLLLMVLVTWAATPAVREQKLSGPP